MTPTVMIMAGGTGGHIFPALTVATQLKAQGWQVIWLGAAGAMETRIVPQHAPDIPLATLLITGVRGKGIMKWLTLPWVQAKAIYHAIKMMLHYRPNVVVGFGGFTSFPGGIAAKLLGIKLVLHEQNAVAGLSNRLLAKIANNMLCAFPATLPKQVLVGNPVRSDFFTLPGPDIRFAQRTGPLRVLVLGGSLGATVLNACVPKALALISDMRPSVIHQAGEKNIAQLKACYEENAVQAQCLPFIDDVATHMAQADLVICRAGASTIAEITAIGAAAIMIPFAAAMDDHQTKNARHLSQVGAGILLPQAELTAEKLAYYLTQLTRADLLTMAKYAKKLAQPDATEKIISVMKTFVR